ncbi:MAG: transcription antitermination factor NusB [Erysipelotrichaceae bacterium]|nr:transcription antitermination factor NusB [Erysipelotrichaceae bacterium]
MKRRKARIMAMQILYASDFNNVSIAEAIGYYDETPVDPLAIEFVNGVSDNMDKIDSIICDSLENYTIGRLNLVDKAIIRLAVYELLNKTDERIVIDEALEITKQFSDQGDHKATGFNNKLLDKIAKNIKE